MEDFDWEILIPIGLTVLFFGLIIAIIVLWIVAVWSGDQRLGATGAILLLPAVIVGGITAAVFS